MGENEPATSGSLDGGSNEDVLLNNKEGSDMGETPEETPILGASKKAQPVVTPAPSAEPVAAAPAAVPKKKSKAGLIITIIVLVLLLVGGGLAAFFLLTWRESAEVSINDAVTKVLEAENKTVSLNMTAPSAMPVTVKIDGNQAGGNFGGSGKISIAGMVDVDFDMAVIKDGKLYIKVDGLKKALKNLPLGQILGGLSGGSSDSGMGDMLNSLISSLGEVIDGEWIKVDVSQFGGENKCGASEFSMLLNEDASKVLAKAYKNNAFVIQKKDSEVKDKDGVKYYVVDVDEEKSKAFKKEIEESDLGKTLKKCVQTENKGEEAEVDASSDSSIVDSFKKYTVVLGIKPWSHELVSVEFQDNQTKSDSPSVKMEVGYEKKEVKEPENAKTLDDLKTKLEEAYKKAMKSYASDYAKKMCQETYGTYGQAYVSMCIKQVEGSLEKELGGEVDFGEILGGLGGGLSL